MNLFKVVEHVLRFGFFCCFCFWGLEALTKLLDPPKATNIEVRFGDDNLGNLILPAISICNNLRVTDEYLNKSGCPVPKLSVEKGLIYYMKHCEHLKSRKDLISFAVGNVTDILVMMQIDGKQNFVFAGPGMEELWTRQVMRPGEVCFTFNNQAANLTKVAIPIDGRFTMRTTVSIYLLFNLGNIPGKLARILFHRQGGSPLEAQAGPLDFAVQAGQHSIIDYAKTVVSSINRPDKPCIDDPRMMLKSCIMVKLNEVFLSTHQCLLPWMEEETDSSMVGYKHCEYNETTIKLAEEYHYLLNFFCENEAFCDEVDPSRSNISMRDVIGSCPKYQTCLNTIYDVTVKDHEIDERFEDYAHFYLNLGKPNIAYIKDVETYDFQSFIGEIGGTLGLFLGLSFSSVTDVLHYIQKRFTSKH